MLHTFSAGSSISNDTKPKPVDEREGEVMCEMRGGAGGGGEVMCEMVRCEVEQGWER